MKKMVLLPVVFSGICIGAVLTFRILNKIIIQKEKLSKKHLHLYQLMNEWVRVKQEKKSIVDFLVNSGYRNIAIYGMNFVGETLLNEVKESDLQVLYGIDKDADGIFADIPVFHPDDELPKIDAIIVTPITAYEDIKKKISVKMECPILSIEDIIYEL